MAEHIDGLSWWHLDCGAQEAVMVLRGVLMGPWIRKVEQKLRVTRRHMTE